MHGAETDPDATAGVTGLNGGVTYLDVVDNPIVTAGFEGCLAPTISPVRVMAKFTLYGGTLLGYVLAGTDGVFGTGDDILFRDGLDAGTTLGDVGDIIRYRDTSLGNASLIYDWGDLYTLTGSQTGDSSVSLTVEFTYSGATTKRLCSLGVAISPVQSIGATGIRRAKSLARLTICGCSI